MTRKSTSTTQPPELPLELLVTQEEAKTRLQERSDRGHELRKIKITTNQEYEILLNAFSKWNDYNLELLNRLFTSDKLAKEYRRIGLSTISFGSLGDTRVSDLITIIGDKINCIDSIIERLELIPLSSACKPATSQQVIKSQPISKKIFVVHGHDEKIKTELELFLHENHLEPVVLHRQADQGLTIIEKFEKYSDVGYAFILLTPDEIAYLASEDSKPDNERHKEFRARPNVLFEFGYFVGKLGRSRVCCLYTGNVSLPSDVQGMIYKGYNKIFKEIEYDLIKELRASGYSI